MTAKPDFAVDPRLDLVFERVVDVPRELVWKAWTTPEHLQQWFCPAPWSVSECELDLRVGGRFNTVMRSPDGQVFPSQGCYLELVTNERLVFTDAMTEGFRPASKPFFTCILTLATAGMGTRYTAIARHGDEATRQRHVDMDFMGGWGKALDQLVAYAKAKLQAGGAPAESR